ncbi:MAG: sigma-54-dependent transcriptional regulator [Phycisphaerales bacterium JB037]
MATILLIEDEDDLRFSIARTLKKSGHRVEECASLPDARAALERTVPDLILSDVNLGNESALEFVPEVRHAGYEGVMVLVTAYASIEDAVRAMRQGADDYLQKPLRLDELSLQVERWLDQRRTASQLRLYQHLDRQRASTRRPLGDSTAWRKSVELAERLAALPLPEPGTTDAGLPTVLNLGETGTGKGVIARHIHDHAADPDQSPPFVHVNCSALPASLIESELFGHEKGAFTDAKAAKPGLFEMAEGGTIFLDEIGEMPVELQSKLLLVVEQGTYRRVGDQRERRVRARIIAATNQDLADRADDGAFRKDLYFRLATFTIDLPPLRERERDPVLIARELVSQFGKRFNRPGLSLADDAEAALARYPWPGNVRELVNVIQRSALLARGDTVSAEDLGLTPAQARRLQPAGPDLRFDFHAGVHTAEEVEKTLMIQALEHTRGNVARAARLIGMQRSSFRYRVERYQLEDMIRELAQR